MRRKMINQAAYSHFFRRNANKTKKLNTVISKRGGIKL